MQQSIYHDTLPAASHWSMFIKKGMSLRLTDTQGGANVGMLFYNPLNLLERYNAPDTLKCQHTFKLTQGHCLYSDMGRIFCSIIEDTAGWHDTVCGNLNKSMTTKKYGQSDYQTHRNERYQNGHDAFLVELAKYGLGKKDLAANINFFSKVVTDEDGNMAFDASQNTAGQSVCLRFEMDTLVIFHTCAHPLHTDSQYPKNPIDYTLFESQPVSDDDACKNHCAENQRGFKNTELFTQLQSTPTHREPLPQGDAQ